MTNMSEGEFKKRMLYDGRTFNDLYFEYAPRLEVKDQEFHPDPLMDRYVKCEFIEKWVDEVAKELEEIMDKDLELYESILEIEKWRRRWFGVAEKETKITKTAETTVQERHWDKDEYYHVVEVQVDEGFEIGDKVRVTVEKLEKEKTQ